MRFDVADHVIKMARIFALADLTILKRSIFKIKTHYISETK